ncbi:MAG: single-stranded DNA-binding protein [Acutalibacteraceae bacterium]|nr:single-stranded DNA-binding protein [Acutalibacteraceae bacterium]
MLNNVILMGRLVAEPELRTTASGVSVCSFTVAVERSYVKQGEERQADFIDCVAWRQSAEFLTRYFAKGQLVALEGSLQKRSYQDKDGNNRYVTEVVVNSVHFTGDRKDRASSGSYGNYGVPLPQEPPMQQSMPMANNTYTSGMPEDFEELPSDDDLPF